MLTEISPELMFQIVESVFITMMNLKVVSYEIPWAPSHDQLTAVIHLSGDRNGTLLFECNRWEACRFAGRFLSMDPPRTVTDDVRDVLGELANMIGGNIKCAVASGLKLSMPSVADGSNYGVRIWGCEFRRLGFECEEGPFWVTLLAVAPGEFPDADQAIELSFYRNSCPSRVEPA